MKALEDFLRREPFPYHILSEALDPFIAHIRDLMGDGISDAFFLLLDFSHNALPEGPAAPLLLSYRSSS